MSEAEMEAVIAGNPNVLGMRMALAERYIEEGQYDKAAEHYGVALNQDPGNPEVQAQAGWLLFKMGNTQAALRFIDQALIIAPGFPDALWYRAKVLLHGHKATDAALDILRDLATRGDVRADLHKQINQLIATTQKAVNR